LSCVVSGKYIFTFTLLKPYPVTAIFSCVPFLPAYRRLNAFSLMEIEGLGDDMELGGTDEIGGMGLDIWRL
jgi:hypothetical protein